MAVEWPLLRNRSFSLLRKNAATGFCRKRANRQEPGGLGSPPYTPYRLAASDFEPFIETTRFGTPCALHTCGNTGGQILWTAFQSQLRAVCARVCNRSIFSRT